MSAVRFVKVSLIAVALAAAPVLLSASDNAAPSKDGKAVQNAKVEKAPSTQFATLKSVKAVPMAAKELDAVKGLHVHFWNPGAPLGGPPHVAGDNNHDNWSNLYGDGLVAPSYHGLCKAAATGSAIFINPHGGCG